MKDIFNQLGYEISKSRISSEDIKKKILFINNRNGSIRWVWPENLKSPLFLKFYNASTWKSRLYVLVVQLIFRLRVQHLVFNKGTRYFSKTNEKPVFDIYSSWALFTGTPGPNNKGIIFTQENGKGNFIKVALNSRTEELLETEHTVLNLLSYSEIRTFSFPKIYSKTDKTLSLSNGDFNNKRKNGLTLSHLNALSELNSLTSLQLKLSEHEGWQKIKKDIQHLLESDDPRLPKGLLRKLNKMAFEVQEQKLIEVGLSHGDFTPWNMHVKNAQLYVYDWELADPLKPLGFDLFHYIIQQGILVDHKNWMEIKKDIQYYVSTSCFSLLSKFNEKKWEDYLSLYLLFNSVYYLKLYSEQKEWHEQVYWLINTWNEALSDILQSKMNHRELVLMDTFDFLLDKNYATIKFQNIYPERLSKLSDIDMCIYKPVAKQLKNYLKTHPLIENIQTDRKTFMSTYQVICKNGGLINMDLIWKMKRKELEFLDIPSLLKNSYVNLYGVKMLNTFDNARYIGLFYVLNNAIIPAKYNYYEEILASSKVPIDQYLYPYFIDENTPGRNLIKQVKSLKCNRGIKGIINQLAYIYDVIGSMFRSRGTIVTFSGVDGSGKSTVIENLRYRIEKQLRRRVIVLRHRPSILPILSALVKGKKQAEEDTLRQLPRTGNNESFFSSLLRFAYYYLDYLIGQLIIHVKYVWRGYVVIYDRYYFDFINDAKRSNIVLPSFISKIGFLFLIKPRFNFFLYAEPEVILKRKQELDKETIKALTDQYLNDFDRLRHNNSSKKYISIKNTDLENTLDNVFSKLSEAAA